MTKVSKSIRAHPILSAHLEVFVPKNELDDLYVLDGLFKAMIRYKVNASCIRQSFPVIFVQKRAESMRGGPSGNRPLRNGEPVGRKSIFGGSELLACLLPPGTRFCS